jgi:hypothetical protein
VATGTASRAGRFLVVFQTPDGDSEGIAARKFCLIGDANLDAAITVLDVFALINQLFAGGAATTGCADVNSDDAVDVLDVFYLINYLFATGPAPHS